MRKKVVIIGAGGHAKVIVDILRKDPDIELKGCTDRRSGGFVLNVPVLGDDAILPNLYRQGIHHAFIALGNNAVRHKAYQEALELGFQFVNAISPFACISDSAVLGTGIAVMPGAIVNAEAVIGNNCIINTGASLDHDCNIGDSCHIAPGCNLSGNVTVGTGTFAGIGSKVIDGIQIGEWSIIGGGSVVIRDIPSSCTAVGVPAKVIKTHGNYYP